MEVQEESDFSLLLEGARESRNLPGRFHARKHGAVQGGGRPDAVQWHTLVRVGFGRGMELPT